MTILGHLPYIIQAILAFIIGTLAIIQVFKIKPYNRIVGLSAVIYSYGIALIAFLASLQFDGKVILLLIKWVHFILILGFISGIYVSYKLGPEEQRDKWKQFLKESVLVTAIVVILVLLINFLAE